MAVTINASTTTGLVQTADTSGVLQLQTAGTTAVTVDASQNVGIGTSSPSAKLQVDAANYALSTSYATLTSNLAVRTTTAQAENVGGEIALGGYNDGSNISDFVRLHGKKLNSTSANVSGYFAVEVSNDSGPAPYMFEQMRITNTGLLQFNSGYGSVATAYGCRAWVNFNGTGTVAIRGSGNVSSITDNGTGDYTVNFTTAMPDTNYAWGGSGSADGNATNGTFVGFGPTVTYSITKNTSNFRFIHQESITVRDGSQISIMVFR
jgi:hypothetical protein